MPCFLGAKVSKVLSRTHTPTCGIWGPIRAILVNVTKHPNMHVQMTSTQRWPSHERIHSSGSSMQPVGCAVSPLESHLHMHIQCDSITIFCRLFTHFTGNFESNSLQFKSLLNSNVSPHETCASLPGTQLAPCSPARQRKSHGWIRVYADKCSDMRHVLLLKQPRNSAVLFARSSKCTPRLRLAPVSGQCVTKLDRRDLRE